MTEISELGLSPEQEKILKERVYARYFGLNCACDQFNIFARYFGLNCACDQFNIFKYKVIMTDLDNMIFWGEWCLQNMSGFYTLYDKTDDGWVYAFTEENDAMMFKLRFG
jgi:hypothetical protein